MFFFAFLFLSFAFCIFRSFTLVVILIIAHLFLLMIPPNCLLSVYSLLMNYSSCFCEEKTAIISSANILIMSQYSLRFFMYY